VGGLKEKILAAHRAGIRRIMIPARNEADIEDVPEDVRKELQIVFVSRINEVIDAALEVLVANPPPPPISTTAQQDLGSRQAEPTQAPLAVRQV
jgi:ATP-dependent Lon protease